jgi:hypothetical protein
LFNHASSETVEALVKAADAAGVLRQLLLKVSSRRKSCLHCAVSNQASSKTVKLLLYAAEKSGVLCALLKDVDSQGWSCLSLAVSSHHSGIGRYCCVDALENVKSLLQAARKAGVLAELLMLEDDDFFTCMDVARRWGSPEIASVLSEAARDTVVL